MANEILKLPKFVETWARKYKPMKHVPGRTSKNKRFYMVDSFDKFAQMMIGHARWKSPMVAMESNFSGDIDEKFITPSYVIYFAVQATAKLGDDMADMAIKEEALDHARKFLAYCRARQEMDDPAVKAADLDDIHFETFGPLGDRWYMIGFAINSLEQYNHCVDENDYDELDEEADEGEGEGKTPVDGNDGPSGDGGNESSGDGDNSPSGDDKNVNP